MVNDSRLEFERLKDEILKNKEQKCANCFATEDLYPHHIVPLASGGSNYESNIVMLCGECHSKVHNVDLVNMQSLMKKGRENARKEGRWVSGIPPYGYIIKNNGRDILINEEEAQIVRLIYEWRYIKVMSMLMIERILNKMAINTRLNGSRWSSSTIKQIMENDVYFGGLYKNVEFPNIIDNKYRRYIKNFYNTYKPKTKRVSRKRYTIFSEWSNQ